MLSDKAVTVKQMPPTVFTLLCQLGGILFLAYLLASGVTEWSDARLAADVINKLNAKFERQRLQDLAVVLKKLAVKLADESLLKDQMRSEQALTDQH